MTPAHRTSIRKPNTSPATADVNASAQRTVAGSRIGIRLAVVGIVLIGVAAFANSFAGEFVFDDIQEIENNRWMQKLLPPWRSMFGGNGLPARPLPYYTFAIDRAIWGTVPFGYHFANSALHLGSALLIFEIVRRTLLRPALVDTYQRYATTIAFFSAALWVAHPLHTQAVTYVYQRIELMMAFFVFFGFYSFLRSIDSPRPRRWLIASVISMITAVFCKESAIALPPMVLLYDVIFVSGSWKEAWQRRSRYYLALFATYLPLAVLVVIQSQAYVEFRDPKSTLSPYLYALNQPAVILHYLRLCFYPTGQCLYSLRPSSTDPLVIVGPLAVELIALGVSAYGVLKKRPWGFLCAAFFVPLFPTSSVIPVKDLVMEHRMYIPLAAVAVATTLFGIQLYRLVLESSGRTNFVRGPLIALGCAAIVCLICTTFERNCYYYDRVVMWEDVVAKAPHNPWAHENLSVAYYREGKYELAAASAKKSLEIDEERDRAHLNLGNSLLMLKQREAAIPHLMRAVELGENVSASYVSLGAALRPTDPETAMRLYERAMEINPYDYEAIANVALVRAREKNFREAERLLRIALSIAPTNEGLQQQLNFVLEDMRLEAAAQGS